MATKKRATQIEKKEDDQKNKDNPKKEETLINKDKGNPKMDIKSQMKITSKKKTSIFQVFFYDKITLLKVTFEVFHIFIATLFRDFFLSHPSVPNECRP